MNASQFWHGTDGQILTVKNKPGSPRIVSLTLAFWPRHPAEMDFLKGNLDQIHFTERSTLARIGIDITSRRPPIVDNNRLLLEAEAFIFDSSFPTAAYFKKLLRPGIPVGRLYYAPNVAKLTTDEIWHALKENRLKLPNTISIDRLGRVYLTPHRVRYTLNPRLARPEFERLVHDDAARNYLDKVQVRHETDILSIPPQSGILTICSMYLKEHFVVLNRGEDNFGIHTGAVLLDPIKTFGTNIMLEIYNSSDQPVVNPVVSVEVFRAPPAEDTAVRSLERKRRRLFATATAAYKCLAETPAESVPEVRPKISVSVKGQSAVMENRSLFDNFDELKAGLAKTGGAGSAKLGAACGYRTMLQALAHAPANADTLLIDYFPNLLEHIELLTRLEKLKLRRIIFRKPSRTHGFFLSWNAHSRIDQYHSMGVDLYWFNESIGDLYYHTYKKGQGFFLREELARKFEQSTILAFYGSAYNVGAADEERIASLIDRLTDFVGPQVGILTGGGGGVMRLATDAARRKGALTGACFLELEAQPPELGVDFFNTFQETSRHFRQKWFEVADFCIFNVGGVGTLEEIGIELCNLKLGIRPRAPYVFYGAGFWSDLKKQLNSLFKEKRAPAWMADYILFTEDPAEVVAFYRKALQVL
ncbi:MAG: LOG family protein [Opitutaceae bacterium]|nr:LOG family protein [Opitutaceae bacterium]